MDIYLVNCPEQSELRRVFMDMYHEGFVENRPIPEFRITSPVQRTAQSGTATSLGSRLGCSREPRGNSHLSGAVFETLPALVPGVRLTFGSDQSCAEATTDEAGRYSISLVPGAYFVEADLAGFCKGRIDRVIVSEAREVRVGITLAVLTGVYQGPDSLPICPLNQETVSLRVGLEVISTQVLFGSKVTANGDIEFRGKPARGLQAIITFGTFVIHADSIVIDADGTSLSAQGHVLVSDSGPQKERRGSVAKLDPSRPVSMETVVLEP